jgi:multiple sugar transport system permease protein
MSVKGRSAGRYVASAAKYAVLGAGAFVMIVPFADMFIGALRTPVELLSRPPVFWPRDPQWGMYAAVFERLPMLRWYLNSVIVTVSITILQLVTSSMAGFALAKYRFPGRQLIFNSVLAAQMFPFFLFIIPMFFILRYWPLMGGNDLLGQGGIGLLGSYTALILPFMITWYGVFLMRQFMVSIPDDLLDAARIDGCSEFRIFWSIVVPLIKPALATLGIFVFIYHWNEFIWTMTVTRSAPELQTVPVGIYLLRGAFLNIQDQSLQRAALAVSVVPVMVLFLALQRFYVRGITMSGIKG